MTRSEVESEILSRVGEWQRAGLLTVEQAERIRRAEQVNHPVGREPAPAAGRREAERGAGGPSVVEALAYVGAALVAAACSVLLGRAWGEFGTALRFTLLAGLAVGGLVAGLLVRVGTDAAALRLRSVLWAGAAVAAGGAAGVLAAAADWKAADVLLVAGPAGAVVAAVLWARCRSVLLHVTCFAGLAATAGAAGAHVPALHDQGAPAAIWLLAVGWVVLGRLWDAVPEAPAAALGSVTAVVSAQVTAEVRWGIVLALLTAAAVVAFAVLGRSIPLLVIGAYGVFTAVPRLTGRLVPGSVGVALGLLVAGATLIAAAVTTVHLRQRDRRR